jgi:hypothetical protein
MEDEVLYDWRRLKSLPARKLAALILNSMGLNADYDAFIIGVSPVTNVYVFMTKGQTSGLNFTWDAEKPFETNLTRLNDEWASKQSKQSAKALRELIADDCELPE